MEIPPDAVQEFMTNNRCPATQHQLRFQRVYLTRAVFQKPGEPLHPVRVEVTWVGDVQGYPVWVPDDPNFNGFAEVFRNDRCPGQGCC